MPRVDTVVSCQVRRSFRVSQVEGMFDLQERETASERFAAELPEAVMPGTSEPWQIGLVVGPSGSGKTTIARAAFGRLDGVRRWPRDRAVVDCFGRRSIKEITAMLTAVGFSSPPAWVKPYRVLSQGERFRCDLARALLTASAASSSTSSPASSIARSPASARRRWRKPCGGCKENSSSPSPVITTWPSGWNRTGFWIWEAECRMRE